MIIPKTEDIGRTVIYLARHPGAIPEEGVITSFNDWFVFARFGSDKHSKASRREDLSWATEKAA